MEKEKQNKKGRWHKLAHPMLLTPYYACSICDENYREKYDFCPNCNADMREEPIPERFFC